MYLVQCIMGTVVQGNVEQSVCSVRVNMMEE